MFKRKWKTQVTIKDFKENLPVGRNADVFLINVVIQKHCARILPRLFPEANPDHTEINWYMLFCTHVHFTWMETASTVLWTMQSKESYLSMLRSSLHCSFNWGSSSSLDCLTVIPLANTVSTRNLQGWENTTINIFYNIMLCSCTTVYE